MVLGELLLEDEHVVYVRKDAVEVGGEQVRLHLLSHLLVARLVELLDLRLCDLGELPLALWLRIVDVLDVLHLQKEGHVWVEAALLQQVVVGLLQVAKSLVILHKPIVLADVIALWLIPRDGLEAGDDLRGGVKLDTSPRTFFMLLQDHVGDDLELGDALELE